MSKRVSLLLFFFFVILFVVIRNFHVEGDVHIDYPAEWDTRCEESMMTDSMNQDRHFMRGWIDYANGTAYCAPYAMTYAAQQTSYAYRDSMWVDDTRCNR